MSRVIVPVDQLPPTSSSAQHVVRFRIVSEDRNRASDWSPIFILDSVGQIPFSGSTIVVVSASPIGGNTEISVTWSGPHIDFHDELDAYPHDVFVRWDNEDYIFAGRVVGNNLKILSRTSPPSSSAQFLIQSPSYASVPGTRDLQNRPTISSILKITESDTIVF